MSQHPLVEALREFAPYLHAHHGRTFVLCIPGEALLDEDRRALIYDIALLRSLGGRLVLVHGARPQIEERLAAERCRCDVIEGLRVTSPAAMGSVAAAVGAVRMELEALLSTGVASSPMGGARLEVTGGNWVVARPVGIRHGIDFQLTGEVRRINVDPLQAALNRGAIVLLSPAGYSPTGETFNLLAEEVALKAAVALRADKLVYLHPEPSAATPNQWSLATARDQLACAPDDALFRAAVEAAEAGVPRVHVVSARSDGALLTELYTRDGIGRMIASDGYDAARPARIDDVGGILQLIEPLERKGILVPRSREQLELDIGRFLVMTRDAMVIGCCALMPYSDEQIGEIACIVVHPDYQREGRADTLLRQAEERARSEGLTRVMALTTHTPHWFIERGFAQADVESLPVEKRALYNLQRNSKVFVKTL